MQANDPRIDITRARPRATRCGACDKYTTGRFHSHTGSSYNGSIQAVDMGCQPLDTLLSLPSSGFPPQETVEIGDETLGGSH